VLDSILKPVVGVELLKRWAGVERKQKKRDGPQGCLGRNGFGPRSEKEKKVFSDFDSRNNIQI
jgi:hypothetical protein